MENYFLENKLGSTTDYEDPNYNCYALTYECYLGYESAITQSQNTMGLFNCPPAEEEQNKAIETSLQAIEAGEEFAFYNLSLSSQDLEILDSIEIVKWGNVVLNSESFNYTLPEEIKNAILSMDGILLKDQQANYLSNLFTRIISIILGQVASKNFKIHIRTQRINEYNQPCLFWHLDKSYEAVLGEEDLVEEKRFIMPFKGSGTNYQIINETTRDKFIELAEEHPRYYGHSSESCNGEDKISKLLSSSKVYKPEIRFGSVHTASRNGAMHAAPNDSNNRLLLLIHTY